MTDFDTWSRGGSNLTGTYRWPWPNTLGTDPSLSAARFTVEFNAHANHAGALSGETKNIQSFVVFKPTLE